MIQLYNAFGAWRWRAIRTIRLLVGALFFAEHGSATERQQVCQNLLNEDRFACMEVRQSNSNRAFSNINLLVRPGRMYPAHRSILRPNYIYRSRSGFLVQLKRGTRVARVHVWHVRSGS